MDILNKTAVYAFACWLATIVSYVAFLAWAFLPESVLQNYGITYYPSKYYALALPAYMIVLYWFVSISYIAVNMIFTLDGTKSNTVYDSFTVPIQSDTNVNPTQSLKSVPEVGDVSPAIVSRYLLKQHLKS